MVRIQTYIVEPGPGLKVKSNAGLLEFSEIPAERETFTLGGRRYRRRSLHVQPPPMLLYVEELPEA